MRRTALITGASAGIGAALASEFASHGYDLVLVARREDRLRQVAEDLETRFGVSTVVLPRDLSVPDAPARLCDELDARGIAVDALVNNAGYGVTGQYLRHEWSTHEQFLHVMAISVAALTHRLLPPMMTRGFGRVLNISSLAAFVPPSAGHTLYGASKAFLLRFSASLGLEVARHGVHVTALCPGFTYSEFHDVNGMRARVSRMPGFLWMDAARVAREGYEAVEAGRLVHIPGRVNRVIAAGARFLPDRVVHLVNARAGRAYRDAT